jgi:hypothetical protein
MALLTGLRLLVGANSRFTTRKVADETSLLLSPGRFSLRAVVQIKFRSVADFLELPRPVLGEAAGVVNSGTFLCFSGK